MTPPVNENSRDFKEFIKETSVVVGVELIIFFGSLVFYHFFIFRRELSREIEKIKLQAEKLERITKGEPEPKELSPTQKSPLLDPESTQKSEKEAVKKKKKQVKKNKTENRKKEAIKKTIRKTNSNKLRLSLEDTQMDTVEMGLAEAHIPPFNPLKSLKTQDSYYENDSLRDKHSSQKAASDSIQVRTCASLVENTVYSPRMGMLKERPPEHADDIDMRTARDDYRQ